jgi:hypothetical protein
MVRGSNPGGGKIFHTHPDWPGSPPSLLQNWYLVSLMGESGQGVELKTYLHLLLKLKKE